MSYISRFSVAALACVMVQGCVSTVSDATRSGFRTPSGTNSTAYIPVALANEVNNRIYDSSLGGAAYVVGTDGDGAAAYAGVMPGSDVGNAIPSGTANYVADYEVVMIEDINVSGTFLTGNTNYDAGSITLTADFDNQTLSGQSGQLRVNGNISGGNLTGGVTYRGTSGRLTGLVGDQGTVGAFHGNSDELVYGGGFVGSRQPEP